MPTTNYKSSVAADKFGNIAVPVKVLVFLLGSLLIFCSLKLISPPKFSVIINKISVENSKLLSLPSGSHQIEINVNELPKEFSFKVDDCLESLKINNVIISSLKFPYCYLHIDTTVLLENVPRLPSNTITATVLNHGGPGSFEPFSKQTRDTQLIKNLVLALGIFLLFFSATPKKQIEGYYFVLFIAMALRTVIASIVAIDQRSPDYGGHLEYIQYIFTHGRIPPAIECWQCYQPPGFYLLDIFFTKLLNYVPSDLFTLGTFPLILSCFCVYFAICLFKLWLPSPGLALYLIPFLLLPGTVFAEISLNNDALNSFLSLLIFYLGSRWYKNPSNSMMMIVSLLVGLGFLNKLSIAPAAAWWAIMMVIKYPNFWTSIKTLGTSGLIILCLNGPYYLYRFQTENKIEVVGNISGLNRSLSVDANTKNFLAFNPIAVVHDPFVSPWENGRHREQFLEYAFLTALFCENIYKDVAIAKIGVFVTIVPICLIFFYILFNFRFFAQKQFAPFLAAILLLAFLALNRFLYPFASSNNFRYIASYSIIFAIISTSVLNELSPNKRKVLAICLAIGVGTIWKVILST